MVRESFASAVARHTAIMEELFMQVVETLPPSERTQHVRNWMSSSTELERLTQLRIEASDYEAQRREGKHLGELVRVIRPRNA